MTTQRIRASFWVAMCILALTAVSAAPGHASPLTFNFTTLTDPGGTLFGIGSFTFDDSLLESPTTSITHGTENAPNPDELTAFSYSDQIVGTLGLPDLRVFAFLFGDENGFAFDAGAGSVGAFGVSFPAVNLGESFSDTEFQALTLTGPTPIPEPTSLLLFGTGIAVLARRVRRCKQ